MIADKPTASLDAGSGSKVVELLLPGVAEVGGTLLAVTHDPALIAAADLAYRLDHGRLTRVR